MLGVSTDAALTIVEVDTDIVVNSDNAHGRILQTQLPDSQTMTVETCVQACAAQNFTVAGLEFASKFFFTAIHQSDFTDKCVKLSAVSDSCQAQASIPLTICDSLWSHPCRWCRTSR